MPVLKVKKNGVWEYVGGVAGGSNLPDYTEEDYGKVLSPSADGLVWTEQTGGNGIIVQPEQPTDVEDGTLWIDTDEEDEDVLEASIGDLNNLATTDKTSLVAAINELAASAGGSGESEFFIVTVDAETLTASHSASEILTAYESGKIVFAKLMSIVFRYSQNTVSGAEFTYISNGDVTRPSILFMYIAEDKTVTADSWYLESAIGQITATVGQIAKVKTIDENGKPTEWEAVDMPSGGGESDMLVVQFTSNDDGTITSSHSGSEIKAAVDAGKGVMGVNQDAYQLTLGQLFANAAMFTTTVFSGTNVQTVFYHVDDNKNVTVQSNAKLAVPAYTESDHGKVLSATADGLVWVDQSGGSGETLVDAMEVSF